MASLRRLILKDEQVRNQGRGRGRDPDHDGDQPRPMTDGAYGRGVKAGDSPGGELAR